MDPENPSLTSISVSTGSLALDKHCYVLSPGPVRQSTYPVSLIGQSTPNDWAGDRTERPYAANDARIEASQTQGHQVGHEDIIEEDNSTATYALDSATEEHYNVIRRETRNNDASQEAYRAKDEH